MTWDYKKFPPGHFDVIVAGVPCTEFPQALTTRPRDLKLGDGFVQRTLQIIRYFEPRLWFVEKPSTGRLRTREYMKGIPFIDVYYCQFPDW